MKNTTRTIATLSITLALALFATAFQSVNAEKHKMKIISGYSKSFYELTEHIEKIDLALKKAALSKDSHSLLSIGSDIRESAAFALSDLAEMDADTPLTNISTFLNQSGDYVKAVALLHSDGSNPSKNEQDTFLMLSRFAEILNGELQLLRGKIASGEISYSAALSDADETLGEHLSRIESEHFSSYKALTYDGAFSAHMETPSSPYLSSLPEISREEALKASINYLYSNVPFVYEGENTGAVPSYTFYSEAEGSRYNIEVTKNGGKLLYYTESRTLNDSVVGTEEAVFHALNFAKDAGFTDLTAVFYEKSGGTLTVTLAPLVNGVIYYTDTIKAEIALDTATVIGFNSEKYLINHKERSFPEVSSEIISSVSDMNTDFIPRSINNCYIPTEFNTEVPCLEVSGTFNEKTYLVYINVQTGVQEEILLLNESESAYFAS